MHSYNGGNLMQKEILYIINEYFNLGVLGVVFSALFVVMATAILIYNAVWCNELRIVKGYRLAKKQFEKINHIDESNRKIFEKKVIKILPTKVRKAWRDLNYYNSTSSKERLRKAIETEYDKGTLNGIVVMLVTYIIAGILMIISGCINVDFNTFHGFSMGIAMVVGALGVLAVVIQMSYISMKYAEVTINLYEVLCDRVAKTSTILVPTSDEKSECNGKIILKENAQKNNSKDTSKMNVQLDNISKYSDDNLEKYTEKIFDEIVDGNFPCILSKADELIGSIKEFLAENPGGESVEILKNCLDEVLGYKYCDSLERKKLLQAKLLLE